MSEIEMTFTEAFDSLWAYRRRQAMRLAAIRMLWTGLVVCLLAFYLDSLLVFGGSVRLGVGVLCAFVLVLTFTVTFKVLCRTPSRERMLARMLEKNNPALNNALINAIEFSECIEQEDVSNKSIDLMSKSIEIGTERLEEVESFASLSPAALGREKRIFFTALGVWIFSAVFFFSWFFTEAGRYIDPFGDHPPYSITKLRVDPKGAVVEYGDDLVISVTAKGPLPEKLLLAMRPSKAEEFSEIGMFNSGEGKFFQTIEEIRSEMIYYVKFQGGRSKYFSIDLTKTPRIESVIAYYKFPEYTEIAARSRILLKQQSQIKGYAGTEVNLIVESNRPLKDGVVKVGLREFKCVIEDENSIKATFKIDRESKYSIAVNDIDGNASTDKFEGVIKLIPDQEPFITIVSPGMHSFATPTAEIPVVIEAHDDLGVGKVLIYRRLNDSEDMSKMLIDKAGAGTFVRTTETFDLADLGVRSGDVIDYYVTATDTLPSRPQTVASESFKLVIISEEEHADFMRSQMTAEDLRMKYDEIFGEMGRLLEQQQQLDQQRRELEQKLENTGSGAGTDEIKGKLDQLCQKQAELAERTEKLADEIKEEAEKPPVFDIEKDYKKSLLEFAVRLDNAGEHMKKALENMKEGCDNPGSCSRQLSDAGDEQAKAMDALGRQTRQDRETIAKANREIEKMVDLLDDVSMFRQLYLAQQHLSRQTWSLKDAANPDFDIKVRLKELGEDQETVKEGVIELKERLRSHGELVEREYPEVAGDAYKIADEIDSRLIIELMEEGRVFLNELNGPGAHPKVDQAYRQMEEMIEFCNSAGGKACNNCQFRLKLKMSLNPGNTMQQLSRGMGSGMGMGIMGVLGRGASGAGGSQSNFAVFGSETFGNNFARESSIKSAQKAKAQAMKKQGQDQLAGNIEELLTEQKVEKEFKMEGDARMMAEYNKIIEAYFQRMAEDE